MTYDDATRRLAKLLQDRTNAAIGSSDATVSQEAQRGIDAAIATAVPLTREITIDGVTQDLSANRTWTTTGGGGLTIEEVDGSPTVAATKFVLPNGTLGVVGTVATYTPAGGGGATTLLDSGTLGVDGAISLASISGSYRHLRLMLSLRTTQAVAQSSARVYLNNDTTAANYHGQRLALQAGSFASNNNGASATVATLLVPGASAAANSYGGGDLNLYDYAGARLKAVFWTGSYYQTAADGTGATIAQFGNGVWLATAAITRIDVVAGSGSLAAGSTWALYGLA